MPRDDPKLRADPVGLTGDWRMRRDRRRALLVVAGVIATSVVLVVIVWLAVESIIRTERDSAIHQAETDTTNLAAAFQEEVSHTLGTDAGAMELVAEKMRAAQGHFDIHDWARDIPLLAMATLQGAIIAPDGKLMSTTLEAHPAPIDLSDREHFRVQLDVRYKGIYVSKPVVGRISKQTTIQLSRRVDSADGRFLGVVVFSLLPSQLTSLHKSLDLGQGGLMAIVGATDHVIRARFSAISPDGEVGAGAVLSSVPSVNGRSDITVNRSIVDGVTRIYARRVIPGYDLYVSVGLDLDEVLAPAKAHAGQIMLIGAVLSVLLIGLTIALASEIHRRSMHAIELGTELRRRARIEAELRASEHRFRDFANLSSDWFWEQDADLRFVRVGPGAPLLGPDEHPHTGKLRWEMEDTVAEPKFWDDHRRTCLNHEPFRDFRYTRVTPDGRTAHVTISGVPIFDDAGTFVGYRGTGRDVTADVVAAGELRAAKDRAEQAEALLRDAVDSISEGFVIYDREDRFVLANEAYRQLFPASAPLMVPGTCYEEVIRNSLAHGEFPEAADQEEMWLAERLLQHGHADVAVEQQCANGKWVLVTERRMRNGGIAGLRIDITRLKQTQFALHESERRLRDFADTSSDWFWEQDAELRFTWLSDTCEMVSEGPQAYVGKRRWEFPSAKATSEAAWERHRAVLEARQPFRHFRYALRREDGSYWHVSVSGKPLFDTKGNFLGYRGSGRDISEEVAAEAAMWAAKERAEQAEAMLRDAVESISEGFVIYDRDDRLVLCNEVYRRLYPHNAAKLAVGVHFEDLLQSSLAAGYYPEAIGNQQEWSAEFLRAHRAANRVFEQQIHDGRWVLVSERRMRNGGIAGLRMDITPLKRAQFALRESEARLDRAQEVAGIGSWELDLVTGECFWSREMYRIRGLTPVSFQPSKDNIGRYLHPEDVVPARQWFADLENGVRREAIDIRVMRPDGAVRICNAEARTVEDENGRVRKLIGTMQDVTERRLTEQQLVHAQKMETIGRLSGGMAHDFNNVLGVIIGNLDLLRRRTGHDPLSEELRDEAAQAALRGADLTRRLLAFARRQPLRPEKTDVNELIDGLARMLKRMLGETVAVSLHLGQQIWPVVIDPAQLEASLSNLVTNARDAMPRGGCLDIITRNVQLDTSYAAQHPEVSVGDYVLIEVSDTGTGIPAEILGQIFEPFFTTKEPGKGSGLGLSMVFGFIKQSGGHVAVYSEVGLGTTFRVYLPRNVRGKNAVDEPDDAFAAVAGGTETVLVVEDDARLRRVTVHGLRLLGYEVLEAGDADTALAILSARDDVRVLFTDVVMPGDLDGLELAARATRLWPTLKVLLTSGFPDMRSSGKRRSAIAAGYRLLNKPYRHDELAKAIRDALDERAVELAE